MKSFTFEFIFIFLGYLSTRNNNDEQTNGTRHQTKSWDPADGTGRYEKNGTKKMKTKSFPKKQPRAQVNTR
jgi:hypothetical protein